MNAKHSRLVAHDSQAHKSHMNSHLIQSMTEHLGDAVVFAFERNNLKMKRGMF